MFTRIKKRPVYCSPKLREHEEPVNQNLSITPTQMDQLRRQGLPISTGILSSEYFDDGNPDPTLTDVDRRGFDICDAWNKESELSAKISEGYNKFEIERKKIKKDHGTE